MRNLIVLAVTALAAGVLAANKTSAQPLAVYNATRSQAVVIDRTVKCSSAIVQKATRPEFKEKLFAAAYVDRKAGKIIRGCGVDVDGAVHLLFEDGDFMLFHAVEFEAAEGGLKPIRHPSERSI